MSVETQDGIDTEGRRKPEYLQIKPTLVALLPVDYAQCRKRPKGAENTWTWHGLRIV